MAKSSSTANSVSVYGPKETTNPFIVDATIQDSVAVKVLLRTAITENIMPATLFQKLRASGVPLQQVSNRKTMVDMGPFEGWQQSDGSYLIVLNIMGRHVGAVVHVIPCWTSDTPMDVQLGTEFMEVHNVCLTMRGPYFRY